MSEQRAALFPTIDLTGSGTRSGSGRQQRRDHRQPAARRRRLRRRRSALDVPRQHRRHLGARRLGPHPPHRSRPPRRNAQASEADLAAARLSAQGELATDYFGLREADAEIAIDQATVEAYQRSLTIAQNRYNAGVAAKSDVCRPRPSSPTPRPTWRALTQQRANFEHAIAVLTGEAPGNFALAAAPWTGTVPAIPPARALDPPAAAAGHRRRPSAGCRPPTPRSACRPRPISRASR